MTRLFSLQRKISTHLDLLSMYLLKLEFSRSRTESRGMYCTCLYNILYQLLFSTTRTLWKPHKHARTIIYIHISISGTHSQKDTLISPSPLSLYQDDI